MEHHPSTTTAFFGHLKAQNQLLKDAAQGRLPNGLIISGPKGIGKATLAYRFARALLAGEPVLDMPADHPVFRRVAAGSHADLLVVEPKFDEKKGEYVREISVEQAREVAKFLALTPAEGDWRVVIIDSADALNINAANAILKILEEPPPQAILLLIAHQPGLLLPTIRSRCHVLKLKPLSHSDFARAAEHITLDLDNRQISAYHELTSGAPGKIPDYEEQGALLFYSDMLELLSTFPLDSLKLHGFAESMTSEKPHEKWRLFTHLVLFLCERASKKAAGISIAAIDSREPEILDMLAQLHPAGVWAAKWQACAEQFSLAERLHLDYKQVIITFFHSIESPEGFQLGNIAA